MSCLADTKDLVPTKRILKLGVESPLTRQSSENTL
jgi:hypothetical protein